MRRANGMTDPFGPGFGKLQALASVIGGGRRPVIEQAGLVLEREIKIELSKPGSGRVYPKRRGRGQHQASAPGQPPAPDLGDLRRTIGREIRGGVMRVGSPLERAPALEFGAISVAPNGTRVVLKPRPFMRTAIKRAEKQMNEAVVAELEIRGKRVGLGD